MKSSTKPTRPNPTAQITAMSRKSQRVSFCAKASAAIRAGRAKITPPMVGMPCFFLCDCGPRS